MPFTAGNSCQATNNRDKERVYFPSQRASLAGVVILCPFVPAAKKLVLPIYVTLELFFPAAHFGYSKMIQKSFIFFPFLVGKTL